MVLHLFARQQPTCWWDNPEVREDFKKTLRFWADPGVDGYRVDVAHALAKDLSEPLRSKPTLYESLGTDGKDALFDRDEVQIYAGGGRSSTSTTRRGPRWPKAFARSERQACAATGLAGVQLRPAEGRLRRRPVRKSSRSACRRRPSWLVLDLGAVQPRRGPAHLALRAAERCRPRRVADERRRPTAADEISGLRRAQAATLLMLALPGSSYLYQGEELGLHEVSDLPTSALQDPIWQRTLNTKKGHDGCRVPMPWTDEATRTGSAPVPPGCPSRPGSPRTRSRRRPGSRSRPWRCTGTRCGSAGSYRAELEWVPTDNPDVLHFVGPAAGTA